MTWLEEKAEELMRRQTEKNKAPAWLLTELAVEKGIELAKKHDVNEELVVVSLYLAHVVFDREIGGPVQKKHAEASADFAKEYLEKWSVPDEYKKIILNAIRAHHGKEPTETLEAEVIKNAECFKFVTLKGAKIFFQELVENRGQTPSQAKEYALDKMEQKRKLLTLEDCKQEAEKEIEKIEEMF